MLFVGFTASCFPFDGALHAWRQYSDSVVVKSLSENGKSYLKNYLNDKFKFFKFLNHFLYC